MEKNMRGWGEQGEREGERQRPIDRNQDIDAETERDAEIETEGEMKGQRKKQSHRETWRYFSSQEIIRRVPKDRGLSWLQGRQTHNDVCRSGSPELVRET